MKQKTALDILKTGRNVFLTGAPGAGKTYTLNQYIEYIRDHEVNVCVTASTGIAASHLNGMTLHSYAGLGVDTVVNEKFLKKLFERNHVIKRLKGVDVLIIDEISMVHPDVFKSIDAILRNVRFSQKPFGGVQLVMSGDFFQLPPIAKSDTEDARYVWQTSLWHELDLAVCYVHEKHRHNDTEFVRILEEVRSGEVTEGTRETLESCYNKNITVSTRLYTHNADVDRINMEHLAQLPESAKAFRAGFKGQENFVDAIYNSSLVVPMLTLKIDAVVIFIKNNYERGYVNGTLGTVVAFDDETGYPLVETYDGEHIIAEPEEWLKESDKGDLLGGVRQVPLRLAWALTVHKSQGMTLDAAEIDLSKSFEVGQGYVALSRVRSLDGLRLLGANDKALEVDAHVQTFDAELQEQSDIIEDEFVDMHPDQLREHQENFILKSGGVLAKRVGKKKSDPKTSTHQKTKELLDKGYVVEKIAEKRGIATKTILAHLVKLHEGGERFTKEQFGISQGIEERVREAVDNITIKNDTEDFLENGKVRLRAIHDMLHKEVSYEDIQCVLLCER